MTGKLIRRSVRVVCLMLLLASKSLLADFSLPEGTNSLKIAKAEVTHRKYTHYKMIGLCWWIKDGYPPRLYTTLEVSEYKPDLVVTVYNQYDDDPWLEARKLVDPRIEKISTPIYKAMLGSVGFSDDTLGEGNIATSMGHMSYANLRSKLVDVIGSPLNTLVFAFPQLDSDTRPLLTYYQSDRDFLGRFGIAEALLPETLNPIGEPIGESAVNSWAFEFPRDMTVNVDNDFKADVVLSLRAADIVTNQNALHTLISTRDSCGENCAVASVKESRVAKIDPKTGDFKLEQFDRKSPPDTLWQEVYPYDKPIQPGENDALLMFLGSDEELKSAGNMVFVIWRHYQGCVQHSGTLHKYTQRIDPTEKR